MAAKVTSRRPSGHERTGTRIESRSRIDARQVAGRAARSAVDQAVGPVWCGQRRRPPYPAAPTGRAKAASVTRYECQRVEARPVGAKATTFAPHSVDNFSAVLSRVVGRTPFAVLPAALRRSRRSFGEIAAE